jgi:hypothetical protein
VTDSLMVIGGEDVAAASSDPGVLCYLGGK